MKKQLLVILLVFVMLTGSVCLSAQAADVENGVSTIEEDGAGGETGGGSGSETGGSSGGETGGGSGSETGGSSGGETGGGSGSETGGSSGGETGGSSGGETGGSSGGESGGNSGGTATCSHVYDAGTVTQKATCLKQGIKTFKCTLCGTTKTETLDYAAHTYGYTCDAWCDVCDAEREVTHTKSAAWSKNAGGHWHRCSVCGEELDKADHYPGPAATEEKDQICLTCGYVMTPKKKHTHKYADKMVFDETGHWYPCEACDSKKDFASHTLMEGCSTKCELCEYEGDVRHTYGYQWESDASGHSAVCAVCGQVGDSEPHAPGVPATETSAQLCNVCSFELAPKTGIQAEQDSNAAATGWQVDEITHWHLDSNGRKLDEALHTWDMGTDRWNGDVVYTCTVCGAARIEGERDTVEVAQSAAKGNGVHWSVILLGTLIVLFVAAVVALIVVVRKSMKAQGKFANQKQSK